MISEYYAIIFTSTIGDDLTDYQEWSDKMIALAKSIPGFISVESARSAVGITVSYWKDLESISNLKDMPIIATRNSEDVVSGIEITG